MRGTVLTRRPAETREEGGGFGEAVEEVVVEVVMEVVGAPFFG